MTKALDIGGPVGPLTIAHRDIPDFEVELVGSEKEIEITKGIEITKVATVRREGLVIRACQNLRATERVFDMLAKQPGEEDAEKFVRAKVQKLHGLLLHRIDEAAAIGKIAMAMGNGFVKFRQILGGHCEIGIQDHEDVARGH